MIGKRWSVLGGAGLAALISLQWPARTPSTTRCPPARCRLPCGRPPDRRLRATSEQHRGTNHPLADARHDRQDRPGPHRRRRFSPHSRSEMGLNVAKSRQLTSSMHVIYCKKPCMCGRRLGAVRAARGCRSRIRRGGPTSLRARDPPMILVRSVGECHRQWFMLRRAPFDAHQRCGSHRRSIRVGYHQG